MVDHAHLVFGPILIDPVRGRQEVGPGCGGADDRSQKQDHRAAESLTQLWNGVPAGQ